MKFWLGRRVWISGHTGFKGSLLAHWLLESGAEIYGYALKPATCPNLYSDLQLAQRMRSRIADVRQADRVRRDLESCGPEVVFHLAAQPLVGASFGDPAATFETNLMGTVNVLEAIRRVSSVRACVIVTSDKCYENKGVNKAFRETDRLGGRDPYSASKAAAEIAIASYRHSFFQEPRAARIASARAGNVIGGGDWSSDRLLPDCIRSLRRGDPIILRNPSSTRPWQHVLEALSGYLRLAELLAGRAGERFATAWNFGPDARETMSVQTIAELAIRFWGNGRLIVLPDPQRCREANCLRLDSTRAHKKLEWSPRWTTEEAVGRTIAWHKARINGADVPTITSREIREYLAAAPAIAEKAA
jgi:CDP-glucose 4,6-dehydratase